MRCWHQNIGDVKNRGASRRKSTQQIVCSLWSLDEMIDKQCLSREFHLIYSSGIDRDFWNRSSHLFGWCFRWLAYIICRILNHGRSINDPPKWSIRNAYSLRSHRHFTDVDVIPFGRWILYQAKHSRDPFQSPLVTLTKGRLNEELCPLEFIR
jgi:hypothetical protein